MSAAAEVLHPVDILADNLVDILDKGDQFFASYSLTDSDALAAITPSAQASFPSPSVQAPTPASAPGAKSHTFPLESEAFVNLQRYLLSAIKLPGSDAEFELEYPPTMLKQYTEKESPGLYDSMRTVLVGLNSHCTDFQNGTMNRSIEVASRIADFGDAATTAAGTAAKALEVMMASGVRNGDTDYQNALTQLFLVIDDLSGKASEASGTCGQVQEGLGNFRTTVIHDRERLQALHVEIDKALPKAAYIDNQMQQMMDKVQQDLASMNANANNARKRLANSTLRLLYYRNLGYSVASIDTVLKSTENAMAVVRRASMAALDTRIAFSTISMQTVLRLRFVTTHLSNSLDEVLAAIELAAGALLNLMGAFTELSGKLKGIDGSLKSAARAAVNPDGFKRSAALGILTKASQSTWPLVASLARRFEEHGLPLTHEIDHNSEYDYLQENIVELLSSNWGGSDVTRASKVLFYFCPSLKIRTVEPGFIDPWYDTLKSISVLHRCGDSLRIFAAGENSGDNYQHILRPGPIDKSSVAGGELLEVKSFAPPPPSNAKITIHAIVWGPQIIQDKRAYDWVYECHASGGKIWFTNDGIACGKDTWPGNPKSGTIYYSVAGGDAVHQLFGQQDMEVGWS